MAESLRSFEATLRRHGTWPLQRALPSTLQVNVGKLCNQACHHCHVDAGPNRTELMNERTAERVLAWLAASPSIRRFDLTGGAPELNPSFARLVSGARALGVAVVVRCNLTVLFEEGMQWLPEFYAANQVEVVCSLPCYTAENVDRQRGRGVFDKSIDALRLLNALGYDSDGSGGLVLDLVYNPAGASLPPSQVSLQAQYREELERLFGVRFRRLLTITNMPIKRFAEMLARSGEHGSYMGLLVQHFNPETVGALMCRDLVSVGWDGGLYDCDFNQMLEIPLLKDGNPQTLWTIDAADGLEHLTVRTDAHCFGCTAGAGSSCGGAVAPVAVAAGLA